MAQTSLRIGCVLDDEESLLGYMRLDRAANSLERLVGNEPEVDRSCRLAADHIGCLSSDMAAEDSSHVEGRLQNLFGQRRSAALGPGQPQFPFQSLIGIRYFGQRSALFVREC